MPSNQAPDMSLVPLTTPLDGRFLHGAVGIDLADGAVLPRRLPDWALAQCNDPQLTIAQGQPAGVRIVFDTTASNLALLTLPTKRDYAGMPARPDGIYELVVNGRPLRRAAAPGGNVLRIDMASGSATLVKGDAVPIVFTGLPAGPKRVEIWLPHDEATAVVSLHSDAPVAPAGPLGLPRWVHHGSSISQGSNATHPTATWPAVAAMRAGVDLTNLGYGGSALLDPCVARTIAALPADIISVKMGINIVNRDLMRLRAFVPALHSFLDTIRQAHPTVPLLLVSPVYCPIHETVPGPTTFDTTALAEGRLNFLAAGKADEVAQGKLTLQVIRAQMQAIVAQRCTQDRALHYIDGTSLYGAAEHAQHPLPDALHPDTASHRLIGERFAQHLADQLGSKAASQLGAPRVTPQ